MLKTQHSDSSDAQESHCLQQNDIETQLDSPQQEPWSSTETTSLKALEEKIQTLENQIKEKENQYLYLYAELENFKKRSIKERSELIKFGWESTARDLLQTLDNLERALEHAPQTLDQQFRDGLTLVLQNFKNSLKKQGIEVIQSFEKPFDPFLHEAIGQEPSSYPSGTVIQEHTKGYTLHGRLLRPARVIVSEGPQEPLKGH